MEFEVINGYSRTKVPVRIRVRHMTLAEVKALSYSDHPLVICNDGRARTVKINGAVKTWKTRPDDVRVSVKYGMYEYASFDTAEALRRFIVAV